jgi:hypothetical protein
MHHRTKGQLDLWVLSRADARTILDRLAPGPFVCVLTAATDDDAKSVETTQLIERLLDAGCISFVCAGACAERLHDIVDEIFVGDATTSHFARGVEMMTTWHDRQTPEEVAFFLLRCAAPMAEAVTVLVVVEESDAALREAIERAAAG